MDSTCNDSWINGNNSAKNIFNITSNNVVLENILLKDVKGTGIIATANNTNINNLKAENVNGNVVDIKGDNAVISNVVVDGGEGCVVSIVGDYPSVRNISATNRKGDLLYINGKGTPDTLTILIGDVTYPNHAQANVTAEVDGNYTITIGDNTYTVTVSDGKGTLTIPDILDVKEYNATIKSSIDTYIIEANTTFTVSNGTIGELSVSVENVNYPDKVIAVVSADVDGEYIVTVNGKPYTVTVNAGKGNVTLDQLPVDNYPGTVKSNIANYNVAVNSTDFSVANGTVSINVGVDNVVYDGCPVANITVSVAGNYTIEIEGKYCAVKELVVGENIISDIPVLPVANYTLKVTSNLTNYNIAVKSTDFSVVNGTITLSVSVDEVTSIENATVFVITSVDGNYTITVNEENYQVTVTNGEGSRVLPKLPAGTYNVTVSGLIENYNPVNKTTTLTVKEDISNVTVDIPEVVADKITQIPVNLPSDATGNVTLIVDGKEINTTSLVNGSAVLTVPGLSAGEHNIGVVYSGDDKYGAFNQTSKITAKKDSNATMTIPSSIEAGKATKIPVNLPSDATGNVSAYVDGKLVDTQPLVNGSCVLTVPAQKSEGNHNVTISYDGNYASFTKSGIVDVKSSAPVKDATVLTFAKKKYTFKKSKRSKTKTFQVTLKTKAGAKLAGKKVFLKLTKVNKIKLSAKTKKAIKKAKAKVKKAKKAYKKSKTAKNKKALAKAKKALTKAKKPQTMLKQLKKGTYAVKTNKKGVAKLTLSKKSFNMKKFKGEAKLTATFKGDSSYLKSTKTVKIVLK